MLKTIVLVGMMGSGKTSVGRELAKSLDINFIDSDQQIELKYRKKIPQIFEIKGEAYFRKIEEKICIKLIDGDPKVLSLGGGAFLNNNIRKKIKKCAFSIWINTSLENIYNRLSKSKNKRPMLDYNNLKNSIKEIYNSRKKIYEKADYTIKSKSDNKKNIIKKIMKKL
ncbi:MAG: shikimate kinase [Pelagibacteraceae bacterium]|jgi:shikimate kinase